MKYDRLKNDLMPMKAIIGGILEEIKKYEKGELNEDEIKALDKFNDSFIQHFDTKAKEDK